MVMAVRRLRGAQGVDDGGHVAGYAGGVDEREDVAVIISGSDGAVGIRRAGGSEELGDGVPDTDVVEVLAGRGAAEDVVQGGAGGGGESAVDGWEGLVDAAGIEAEDVVAPLEDGV